MAKVTATLKGDKAKLQRELYDKIVQSTEKSPELKKEIERVFQVANRRIQNIESKGLFSPAVQALANGGRDMSRYSKFSVGGKSWNELKKEYAECMAFLEKGTSTATGTRKYNDTMAKRYGMTPEQLRKVHDKVTQGGSLTETQVLTKSATYAVICDLVMEEARREKGSGYDWGEDLERQIEETAARLSHQVSQMTDSAMREAVAHINMGI